MYDVLSLGSIGVSILLAVLLVCLRSLFDVARSTTRRAGDVTERRLRLGRTLSLVLAACLFVGALLSAIHFVQYKIAQASLLSTSRNR